MNRKLRLKGVLLLLLVAGLVYVINPPRDTIVLGLDLQGGIHLVMRVHTEDAVRVLTDETAEQFAEQLDNEAIDFADVETEGLGRLTIRNLDESRLREVRDIVAFSWAGWDLRSAGGGDWSFDLRPSEEIVVREQTVTQAMETIRRRVDELGVAEPVITTHGNTGDQILVQLPGYEDVARAKEIIQATAQLELRLVQAGPALDEAVLPPLNSALENIPTELPTGATAFYQVNRVAAITGRDLRNARQAIDFQTNTPNVEFSLHADGASRFREFTGANVGRQMAIVLDDHIVSAPVIQSPIYDQGQITGNFTVEEALDLALVLRAGALPASLEYQEERTVGPSLGADSIRSGVTASLVGLAGVLLFIIFYYRLSGINAVTALVLNLLILIGAMAYFAATLTLPGIAGVILTIGMGVDANVLIFERIKEEMRTGKPPRTAISVGFSRVFWTIVDANMTSLVAAAILFQFGTGPVQGFAVTLSIGLISNVFTAMFVSRYIFDLVLSGRRQVAALSI